MAIKIYQAPDGTTWQYEEGKQPVGYVEAKARTARNKRRTARNKGRGAATKDA